MTAYDWPGNVRELANAIEHAVVLGSGAVIDEADLPSRFGGESFLPVSENVSYRYAINAARRELIVKTLHKTDGNRTAAARLLGLDVKYLIRLMKALQIR